MITDLEWIRNLKVFDEVAIDESTMWHKHRYRIVTVTKISPSGRIVMSDGSKYMPNGKKIGESYCYNLKKVTPEILDIIERRNLMNKIKFDKIVGGLTAEKLKIILEWQEELLKESEKE